MTDKQTPKQAVLAVYPKAVAIKLDAKTVMSVPTWAILEENDQYARTLGENGSANGAWKNAADNVTPTVATDLAPVSIGIDPGTPAGDKGTAVLATMDANGKTTILGTVNDFKFKKIHTNPRGAGKATLTGTTGEFVIRLLAGNASDTACQRALGRVNGMSKLRSDSQQGTRLDPRSDQTRQQERAARQAPNRYDRDGRGTVTRV